MKAYLIHPEFRGKAADYRRGSDAHIQEASGLIRALDIELADAAIVNLAQPKPSTLLGKGKVEEISGYIAACDAKLVVVNTQLSPVQQRNLEKVWNCKVIDRTALILEIFGARARTYEGRLQVELAALEYQKSRLVRSWTHLERQRGGFGFLGGPGESQIEIDRRLIRNRIAKIKKQLEQVVRTRQLHRKVRRDTPYPIVALVGYTNAGKSTLFNVLTGDSVLAEDKLFATLDPTMRAVRLPSGMSIILSDTVGFISNLPTELIAAFRATLEEVLQADLLLHVRDVSHPDTQAQKSDVEEILCGIYESGSLPENILEVRNKIDKLDNEARCALANSGIASISAISGEGIDNLRAVIDSYLSQLYLQKKEIILPIKNGKAIAWLHAHATVSAQEVVCDESYRLAVHIAPENFERFRRIFSYECANNPDCVV